MLVAAKTYILRSILACGALVALLGLTTSPVSAVTTYPYGNTAYGECSYGYGCGRQTQVVTPAGLEVAINLTDGQSIPETGYTITVTPLNGGGRTFDRVEFWLDGVLVHTAYPGGDGTATWFWDPSGVPGTTTHMTVIVIDTDGTRITEEFDLTIAEQSVSNPDGTPGAGSDTGTNPDGVADDESQSDAGIGQTIVNTVKKVFGGVAQQIGSTYELLFEGAKNIIRAVPAPVVFAFPYFLLLLILLNILLLITQAHREVQEYKVLQGIVARSKRISDAKKNLAQLVSHYLRTPMTLLMGGVDMLKQDEAVQAAVKDFDAISNRLHIKIEGLIAEAVNTAEGAHDEVGTIVKQGSIWKQRAMFLPLFITPLVLIPFNYVAASAGTFTSGQISIVAQIIIFAILITTMYIVLRSHQLRRRDSLELQAVLEAESAVSTSRDGLISTATDVLDSDLKEIDRLIENIDSPEAVSFIKMGQARFRDMLAKLRVATRLKGLHSEAPVSEIAFTDLFAKAMTSEQEKAVEKKVTVTSTGQAILQVQSPDLVSFVLQSLVDNAIAYSNEGGAVEVSARGAKDGVVVSVTDHGQGIPEEKLPMLFQPFTKAEGAEVFTHEGMGFSLYLDKLITEYVGASIEAVSRPGKETTFSLTFPTRSVQ